MSRLPRLHRVALVLAALPAATRPIAGQSPNQVIIYRDDWGVPHLYAEREEAGYFGLGYAMAEDELDYVLRLVLSARGESAAAFGPANVGDDFTARLWRHAAEAKAGFARLSPELQRNYRAWVAGLDRWMTEHRDQVPAWAPRLEPWDPVAISRWLLWLGYQAGEGLADCRRGGVTLSQSVEAAMDRRQVAASNEWVLAPWRTADGATIMLSDPHGGVDGQFVYEFRMHAGALELAGYTMGALPLLVQNRRVAWGMTTGAPDVADCYEIRTDPRAPRRYQFDGKPLTMVTERISIRVNGAPAVTRVAEYTRHNGVLSPVVARQGDKAYVVSTAYMHDAGVFDEELYRMTLARNVDEVREAMKRLGMFPQNVMVGDADGNSFYVRAGKTPKRPAGFRWDRPVPGNSSETAWLGIHPLEDLVQVRNPAGGFMQNNNISPDMMMERSPMTPDRYPDYIFHDLAGRTSSRGRRAVEVLSRATHFTVQDAIDLALDEKWMDTDRWREALRRAANQDPARLAAMDAEHRTVLQRLLDFDGQARAGSVAARNYWHWWDAVTAQPGGLPMAVLEPAFQAADTIDLGLARRLMDAVDSAVAAMDRNGGSDRPLGAEFRIGRGGEASWPVGGISLVAHDLKQCETLVSWNHLCLLTLRAYTAGPPDSLGRRHAAIGSRLLRLTIFTDPIQSFTAHNFGQSGRPDSPHFDDQAARLTSLRRLKPVYFDRAELLPHVRSQVTLDVPSF